MPPLETKRLLIRNLKEDDLDAFLLYRSIPEVARYQGFEPYTREQGVAFIQSQKDRAFGVPGQWLQLGITMVTNNQLIGDCAIKIHEEDTGTAEIGCTISPAFQQRGFAKETLEGLLRFLFEEKNIRRIVETTDADNTASIQLLKSLGFRQEGHFKENVWFKGQWGSEYQFALLKSEWAPRV